MKTNKHKKENDNWCLFLLGWWPPRWRQQPLIFCLAFLLEPGQRPLAGQTWIQNLPSSWGTGALAISRWTRTTKNLQMKNQRFQFWRLSVDNDWSANALNTKSKDFNQGCWPQIMPSSAKPRQAQPEALRFSQLKKKTFEASRPFYELWRGL